ncbi:MAG: RNA-guided endonuclease TnpB family protein [Senegalia sp. (in: firmicutes)]|uniref:RNA-guided endonuclease TnpB family protein n=1 Tax=Senegalia sp. (in: firmicutes) TaxID=1924098 RepID=UPI003F9BE760
MKKKKNPTYILELKLDTEIYHEHILNKRFEIGRKIYNAVLGEGLKRYNHLKRMRIYKALLNELIKTNKNIKTSKNKKSNKELNIRKKEIAKNLNDLRKNYGVTEYSLHDFVKPIQHIFKGNIDSLTAQKIATRAWLALEKYIFSDSKRVYFKKYGELNSLEGKNNKSGIKFRDNHLIWNGLSLEVKIRKNDMYAKEALKQRIKYCRIVRKIIKGKYKYYIQLVLAGFPPVKRSKEGEIIQKYGESRIGIDPSLRSIAYASDIEVRLKELAPSLDNIDREIKIIQRKLDRSRRITNPNKYNEDGTIKRDSKDRWYKSKNYMKNLFILRELNRRLNEIRKIEHNILANYLLTLGTDIFVEKTDFKALAKRAKETSISEKTGRFKRKKRFGKSIGSKAPSKFFSILDKKLNYIGKEIKYIDTWKFKASQYNHYTDECRKVSLSVRWKIINDKRVQRDLYSAFLIMNSKDNLKETDRDRCNKNFERFLNLQDEEIKRLKTTNNIKLFSSFCIE